MLGDPRKNPGGSVQRGTHWLTWMQKRTITMDLAAVGAATFAEQDVTPTGADITAVPIAADEVVIAIYPAAAPDVAVHAAYARVKSAGVLTVGVVNPSAGSLNGGATNTWILITGKFAT